MSATSRLAVELTKGDDFLNIWVDANNNGIRDDDDVNIYVTRNGSFFTESPTFKQAVDAHIKEQLRIASLALIEAGHNPIAEEEICDLALELVLRATQPPAAEEAPPIAGVLEDSAPINDTTA